MDHLLLPVGDDWQSICRFSGSDITIFTQFEANFGANWRGHLEQTYSCNQLIAATAAKFVQRNPEQTWPAIARSIRVIPVDDERGRPDFAKACRHLLERLDTALGGIAAQWRNEPDARLKVLVLWRYNGTVFSGCNQFPDCRHSEGAEAHSAARLRRRA